jgi:hypothetical protein
LGKRASGIYTVTLQDAIGRQSSVGFSVIRDTTPPTLTLEAVVQSDVLVAWSATDPSPGSGLDTSKCLLKVREDDEGTWQAFSTDCGGEDATYDGQPGYTYTFRLSASDNVGNAASLEVEAVVPYVKKYYYANGQRVAMRQGDVVYYIHSDHLGSTSVLSDGSGQQAGERVAYLPYGGVRLGEASTLPTDYTFTGQRLEAGLGLMHYGARFYSTHNSERNSCRILTRKVWPSGWLDHVVAPDCHQLDTPLTLHYTFYQDNAIDARGEKTQ